MSQIFLVYRSEEDTFIAQHMKDLHHSLYEYFSVPDANKHWFEDPFSVNMLELEGLATAEEDNLIEIYVGGVQKLQFKEQFFLNVWAHLQSYFSELSKRAMKVLMLFLVIYLCEKLFFVLIY